MDAYISFLCLTNDSIVTKTLHHQQLKGILHVREHSQFSTKVTLKTVCHLSKPRKQTMLYSQMQKQQSKMPSGPDITGDYFTAVTD